MSKLVKMSLLNETERGHQLYHMRLFCEFAYKEIKTDSLVFYILQFCYLMLFLFI